MLNAPIIGALLVEVPSFSLQQLHLLFPSQMPACEAFMKATSLPDFLAKIANADFNTLEQFSMGLTNMGVPYNLAMPTLTTWRSALSQQQAQGMGPLLSALQSEQWEMIKNLQNPILLRYAALAKLKTGDFAGASADFLKLLETEPQNTDFLCGLARCYVQLDSAIDAVAAFEKALMFDNTLEGALLPELREARSKAEASLANMPNEYWLAYLEKLFASQQFEQLGKTAQRFLQKEGFPQAEVHFYIGLSLQAQYNYKEAIQQFDKALALKEDHLYYTHRGIAKYNSNKGKDALKDFQKALAINEEDDQARQYLEMLQPKGA
jgi:tetratricopeptide (TPR) repeat protein